MTYAPTHRTELLDANMRQCVPEPKPVRVATKPGRGFDEAEYTRQMLALVGTKGHRPKMPFTWGDGLPGRNGLEAADVTAAMFTVMNDWIVPVDIAAKVSEVLGREVKVQLINNRLHSNKSGRFVSKPKTKRTRFWKLKVAK